MIHDYTGKAEQSPRGLGLGSYGWQHAEWNGSFYPDDLPEDWQLGYYANQFSAVLVPQAYWQKDTGFDMQGWQDDVAEDFRFYIEWPFDSVDGKLQSLCLQQCQSLGQLLGGIIVNQDIELKTYLPVYYRHQQATSGQQIWTVENNAQSGVALVMLAEQDLRTQRKWLEQFAVSTEHLHCVLLSDASPDIDSLGNLKTLIELLGL